MNDFTSTPIRSVSTTCEDWLLINVNFEPQLLWYLSRVTQAKMNSMMQNMMILQKKNKEKQQKHFLQ